MTIKRRVLIADGRVGARGGEKGQKKVREALSYTKFKDSSRQGKGTKSQKKKRPIHR
jgi:hypothetical protein